MKAWEDSRETQEDFARAHGLSVSTLRNWIRQHGENSPSPEKALELRELDLGKLLGPELASRSSGWEAEIRLPSGVTLCVARETPVNRVRELVEALRC